jgi:hypothetical protein
VLSRIATLDKLTDLDVLLPRAVLEHLPVKGASFTLPTLAETEI